MNKQKDQNQCSQQSFWEAALLQLAFGKGWKEAQLSGHLGVLGDLPWCLEKVCPSIVEHVSPSSFMTASCELQELQSGKNRMELPQWRLFPSQVRINTFIIYFSYWMDKAVVVTVKPLHHLRKVFLSCFSSGPVISIPHLHFCQLQWGSVSVHFAHPKF